MITLHYVSHEIIGFVFKILKMRSESKEISGNSGDSIPISKRGNTQLWNCSSRIERVLETKIIAPITHGLVRRLRSRFSRRQISFCWFFNIAYDYLAAQSAVGTGSLTHDKSRSVYCPPKTTAITTHAQPKMFAHPAR